MTDKKLDRMCLRMLAAFALIIVVCGAAFFAFALHPTATFIPGGRELNSRAEAEQLPGGDTLLAGTIPDGREINGEQYILYYDGYTPREELPERSSWNKLQCTVKYVGGENELSIYFDGELLEGEQPWRTDPETVVTEVHGTQISYQIQYQTLYDPPGEQIPAELTVYFEKDGHGYVFKSSFALQAVNAYRTGGMDGATQCLTQAWTDLSSILSSTAVDSTVLNGN